MTPLECPDLRPTAWTSEGAFFTTEEMLLFILAQHALLLQLWDNSSEAQSLLLTH